MTTRLRSVSPSSPPPEARSPFARPAGSEAACEPAEGNPANAKRAPPPAPAAVHGRAAARTSVCGACWNKMRSYSRRHCFRSTVDACLPRSAPHRRFRRDVGDASDAAAAATTSAASCGDDEGAGPGSSSGNSGVAGADAVHPHLPTDSKSSSAPACPAKCCPVATPSPGMTVARVRRHPTTRRNMFMFGIAIPTGDCYCNRLLFSRQTVPGIAIHNKPYYSTRVRTRVRTRVLRGHPVP